MPVFHGFFERFLVVHVNFGVGRELVAALESGGVWVFLFFHGSAIFVSRDCCLTRMQVYSFQLCSRGLYVNVHAFETRDGNGYHTLSNDGRWPVFFGS